jgi:hypothetical protein
MVPKLPGVLAQVAATGVVLGPVGVLGPSAAGVLGRRAVLPGVVLGPAVVLGPVGVLPVLGPVVLPVLGVLP